MIWQGLCRWVCHIHKRTDQTCVITGGGRPAGHVILPGTSGGAAARPSLFERLTHPRTYHTRLLRPWQCTNPSSSFASSCARNYRPRPMVIFLPSDRWVMTISLVSLASGRGPGLMLVPLAALAAMEVSRAPDLPPRTVGDWRNGNTDLRRAGVRGADFAGSP
jgi:hypothetical protein